MNVLIKLTGSISLYKMCGVVSSLKKLGHSVRVVASKASLNFVGASTWEALSGNSVFTDEFMPERRLDHIYLNDWADIVVLAPATAKTLNQISLGVGDGVVNTLFLSRKKQAPYLIFPAMNPRMWEADSVTRSVSQLSSMEMIEVIGPAQGLMSCGHIGKGRLLESEIVLDEILKRSGHKRKVLITLGGTSETLDGVRSITNFSSGETGRSIAAKLRRNYKVTVLGSEVAINNLDGFEGCRRISFKSSDDLEKKLLNEIRVENFKMIIHLAAVSDFVPMQNFETKISSDTEYLDLKLKKRSKILNKIKETSQNKETILVSFKLTHGQNDDEIFKKIKKQFNESSSNYVVQNKLSEVDGESHIYEIWDESLQLIKKGSSKEELSTDLMEMGEK